MKLFFVGAALLISVLSTDAQNYIPDLPPPEYRGFRNNVPFGNSIPRNPSPLPFKRFGSYGYPDYWGDVSFRNSVPQRLPFWFPRSFGSSWPFRHFGSGDHFRSEKLIHMLGKLIKICREIVDQARQREPRRNPWKMNSTFKTCCRNPMNQDRQPFLSIYGYLGFLQGYPFYPQGFPFYSQGYSEQESNYWNPSNPVMNSYPNLVLPEPFLGQPLSPAQPQIGYVPSVLYSPQNYAGVALFPLPQYVLPLLVQRASSTFAYRARPAPPPHGRPAPPPHGRPAPPSHGRPTLLPHGRPAPPPHGRPAHLSHGRPAPPPHGRPAPPPHGRPAPPSHGHPTLLPHGRPAPPPHGRPAPPPYGRPAPPPHDHPTPLPHGRPAPPPRDRPAPPPRVRPATPPRDRPTPPPRDRPASVSSAVQSPDTFALPASESAASKAPENLDQKSLVVEGQISQKSPQTKPQATEEITELDI